MRRTAEIAHDLLQGRGLREHGPRLRQQEFSGLGHHDAARMPHEQLLFKILFQLADLQAQRRLGDVRSSAALVKFFNSAMATNACNRLRSISGPASPQRGCRRDGFADPFSTAWPDPASARQGYHQGPCSVPAPGARRRPQDPAPPSSKPTVPSPAIRAMTRSPGRIAHIGPSAPVITISPALNGVPNAACAAPARRRH